MRFVCHPTQGGATCLLPAHWLISGGSGRIMAVSTQQNVSAAGIDVDWLTRKIDYRNYQECVHCGLCTASCPTYVETANENDSPRGRIYLMRAVTGRSSDGRARRGRHLELCLDCRACESACPSGVRYGTLIEPFKIALQKDAPREREPACWSGSSFTTCFPMASGSRRPLRRRGCFKSWACSTGRRSRGLPERCRPLSGG